MAAANLSNRRWGVRVRTLGGRYRLETPLGKGGMAVVWRARDLVLGRQVAVKLLAPTLGDRLSRERIRAEAQVAARLAHPNVASVYDFGESRRGPRGRVPYIVMELVDGDTLATRQQGDRLHWRTAVCIAAEVAAALAAAHACGVVHRDVKPGNIMLARAGVKVVDFGIAAAVGALEVQEGELLGTPAYVAPERLAGDAAVPATDVYALGVVLYECLAGTLPWSAETVAQLITAHRELRPEPLPPIEGLPADVAELCEQCLRKDPQDRPTSLYAALVLAEAAGVAVTLPPVDPDLVGATPADDAGPPAGGATAAVRPGAHRAGATGTGATRTGATRTGATRTGATRTGGTGSTATGAFRIGSGARLGAARRNAATSVPRRRRAAAAVGLVGLLAAGAAVTSRLLAPDSGGTTGIEAAAPPNGGCAARYVAEHRTGGAFTAEVTITNTGAALLDSWSLAFALPAGQRITDAQGARWNQQGDAVTLQGQDALAAGDTRRMALTGIYGSATSAPTRFTLDGEACAAETVDAHGGPAQPDPGGSPGAVAGSGGASPRTGQGAGNARVRGPSTRSPAMRSPAPGSPSGGSAPSTGSPSGGAATSGSTQPTTPPPSSGGPTPTETPTEPPAGGAAGGLVQIPVLPPLDLPLFGLALR